MEGDHQHTEGEDKAPNYILSALQCKCPRCRRGPLFESKSAYALKNSKFMRMNEKCPVCGQATELEVGFYYGTSYVAYALTVAFSVATFIAWKVFFGISFDINDNNIFWWFGVNAILLIIFQPIFMRLSRSFWLSIYVKYNKNWRTEKAQEYERLNKDFSNGW